NYYPCFFFSSRRRHTRSKRDWSSDVCSSDLPYRKVDLLNRSPAHHVNRNLTDAVKNADFQPFFDKDPGIASVRKLSQNFSCPPRSEERRVGKEYSYRKQQKNDEERMQRDMDY